MSVNLGILEGGRKDSVQLLDHSNPRALRVFGALLGRMLWRIARAPSNQREPSALRRLEMQIMT